MYMRVDYTYVAYQAIDMCVSVVITILQITVLCKHNNHITQVVYASIGQNDTPYTQV